MKSLILSCLLGLSIGCVHASSLFTDDPSVIEYAKELSERHGFVAEDVLRNLATVKVNQKVLQLIRPPATPTQRSWERYRPRFINERRVDHGVRFWQENQRALAKASALTGVPPEIIVAIIGVETEYGRNKGGFKVIEALATLAFHYPPRADFFRSELTQFLLLCQENNLDPLNVKGSFAGAIGIPQFMPGSQRRYAIDFDGDQRVDLANSVDDAIGSVARFLEQHGWQRGEPIAFPARFRNGADLNGVETGIRPILKVAELTAQGIISDAPHSANVALIDLVSPGSDTEYWLGFENFYVITRYNRSSFYAMSVFQLSEAIKARISR